MATVPIHYLLPHVNQLLTATVSPRHVTKPNENERLKKRSNQDFSLQRNLENWCDIVSQSSPISKQMDTYNSMNNLPQL